jgi:hypothetical protein
MMSLEAGAHHSSGSFLLPLDASLLSRHLHLVTPWDHPTHPEFSALRKAIRKFLAKIKSRYPRILFVPQIPTSLATSDI